MYKNHSWMTAKYIKEIKTTWKRPLQLKWEQIFKRDSSIRFANLVSEKNRGIYFCISIYCVNVELQYSPVKTAPMRMTEGSWSDAAHSDAKMTQTTLEFILAVASLCDGQSETVSRDMASSAKEDHIRHCVIGFGISITVQWCLTDDWMLLIPLNVMVL